MPTSTPLSSLSYEELLSFIASLDPAEPESATLDFKRDAPKPDGGPKVARAIAAMANGGGGTIVYGVEEEKGKALHIRPVLLEGIAAKFSEWIGNLVRAHIDPPPTIDVRTVSAPDDFSRALLIVEIEESLTKPVQTKDGRFPLRSTTTTSDATRAQVIDMIYATRSREERLARKLASRKLLDMGADDFCLNQNAKRIPQMQIGEKQLELDMVKEWLASRPMACFSVLPVEALDLGRLTTEDANHYQQLARQVSSWEVMLNPRFTVPHTARRTASGLVLHNIEYRHRSILELHTDEYAEVVSTDCWYVTTEYDQPLIACYLSGITGFAATFLRANLNFILQLESYTGDVLLTIALRGNSRHPTVWPAKGRQMAPRQPPLTFCR